jgi:hypothetical protein
MALEIAALMMRLGEAWEPNPAPAEGALDRATRTVKAPMPAELRAIYERANGATVGQVDVFTLGEYEDVNKTLAKKMRFATFFASDGSDGFFFVDRDDALHRGQGAVFWVDRGHVARGECIPCGVALYPFLLSAGAGLVTWDGPRLKEDSGGRLKAALAKHAAHVEARPPAAMADLLRASDRVGVFLPESLRQFLRVADGLVAGDVTLFGCASVQASEERSPSGHPVAVWFGERAGGIRYAASVVDWRDEEGGRTVVVAPGQKLADAPLRAPVVDFVADLVEAVAGGRKVEE